MGCAGRRFARGWRYAFGGGDSSMTELQSRPTNGTHQRGIRFQSETLQLSKPAHNRSLVPTTGSAESVTPELRSTPVRSPSGPVRASEPKLLSRVRAWMIVPVADFVLLLAPQAWRPHQIQAAVAFACLATFLLSEAFRYRAPLHLSVLDDLPFLLTRLLTSVAVISAAILLLQQRDAVVLFLQTAMQAVALVIMGRVLTSRLILLGRRMGIAQRRAVLIGSGRLANELAGILAQRRDYGMTLVGFVDEVGQPALEMRIPRLGRLADLDGVVEATRADAILLADGDFTERDAARALRKGLATSTDLFVIPRMPEFHRLTANADHIGSIAVIRVHNNRLSGPASLIKRVFDVLVASAALIALLPLMLLVAFAVRIDGGPGVIFQQVRIGRFGRHFELYKFRTVKPGKKPDAQTKWCVLDDDLISPLSRFLRATSIDELPQLWNIIRGDMTLVGPRPERPHFVECFSNQYEDYSDRHRVQVGLTGLAQVSGLRGDTSIADRTWHDNFYIENWSPWLDAKIIIRTFREVVLRHGR